MHATEGCSSMVCDCIRPLRAVLWRSSPADLPWPLWPHCQRASSAPRSRPLSDVRRLRRANSASLRGMGIVSSTVGRAFISARWIRSSSSMPSLVAFVTVSMMASELRVMIDAVAFQKMHFRFVNLIRRTCCRGGNQTLALLFSAKITGEANEHQ